jgi:hypothetical protein
MLTTNLYKSVLINPLEEGVNKLFIVSGYASATFARRHLLECLKLNPNLEINLIIGMSGAKNDHLAFLNLHEEFSGNFQGYYVNTTPLVHSKIYAWYNDDDPILGYAGSANYSQYGFFEQQQNNQISSEDPQLIKSYFDALIQRSIYMPNVPVIIPAGHQTTVIGSLPAGHIFWEIPDTRVRISFLSMRNGELPTVSGLNWGQRLAKNTNPRTGVVSYSMREPNQAYLSIKQSARDVGFLPTRAFNFTLVTDDGHSFDCVVAQENRKAIESTNNNSELGVYIRNRIGVPLGQLITRQDLENYGRTDFTLEKIDEETFLFDFSIVDLDSLD